MKKEEDEKSRDARWTQVGPRPKVARLSCILVDGNCFHLAIGPVELIKAVHGATGAMSSGQSSARRAALVLRKPADCSLTCTSRLTLSRSNVSQVKRVQILSRRHRRTTPCICRSCSG